MSDDQTAPEQPADRGGSDVFENLGRKLDEMPAVQVAEQALRRATEELRRAQARYEQVRSQAVDQINDLREKTPSEIFDVTLECVRKHPGPGVVAAALVGFFLGRLFRR